MTNAQRVGSNLHGIGMSVDLVFRSNAILGPPVKVELLQIVRVR